VVHLKDRSLGFYYSLYNNDVKKPPSLMLFYMLMISIFIFQEKNTKV